MKKARTPEKDFINAVVENQTTDKIADALGIQKVAVSNRISKLIAKGVLIQTSDGYKASESKPAPESNTLESKSNSDMTRDEVRNDIKSEKSLTTEETSTLRVYNLPENYMVSFKSSDAEVVTVEKERMGRYCLISTEV